MVQEHGNVVVKIESGFFPQLQKRSSIPLKAHIHAVLQLPPPLQIFFNRRLSCGGVPTYTLFSNVYNLLHGF